MTLSNPRIGYVTVRDAILTLLRANLSTLNSSLNTLITSGTKQIVGGDPELLPAMHGKYPMIFVTINDKTEPFEGIGRAHSKRPFINYFVYGAVRIFGEPKQADDEIMNFADNIEAVFRDNVDGYGGIIFGSPDECDFKKETIKKNVYVGTAKITLRIQKEVI